MKAINRLFLLITACLMSASAIAASAKMHIVCAGKDDGAEVYINGKFRGECPVDIFVPEGRLKLVVRKVVDADHEWVFEKDIRMADDSEKKVEVVFSLRKTAASQKHEEERLAVERAEAQRHEAEHKRVETVEDAETPKREAERAHGEAADQAEAAKHQAENLRVAAQMRNEFDAVLKNGAFKAVFRDCADCPEMVAIAPGVFEMGSNNGTAGEKPAHRVVIGNGFALGKTEVTQKQWQAVMGKAPSKFSNCGDDCPVEQVSWNDVQAYIQKLNARTGKQYRLPSEAEWEYACRAGRKQEYCGGENPDSVGWYEQNSGHSTHPVGRKQANAFGLYDMSGNVWEWVEDSYHANYNGAPSDGTAWQGDRARRVLRGGSWSSLADALRSANRSSIDAASRGSDVGFRVARTLP